MPVSMVASSLVAQYWPSRYSSTYEGTMALPFTAFTKSLRTTRPAKCSLILSSSWLMRGCLEIEFAGERAVDRIAHRLVVGEVRGAFHGLFQSQLDLLVVY